MLEILKSIFFDKEFWKLLISISAPVLVAIVGFFIYKKQAKYELFRKRYLEEGFDRLIDDYENAMFSYRHNWQLSFNILRQIRDVPKKYLSTDATEKYFGLGEKVLPTIAVHRINKIFNSNIIWKLHQDLYQFVQQSYFTFEYDFKLAVKVYLESEENKPPTSQEVYNLYLKTFKDMDEPSKKFSLFIGAIKMLSTIFENNIYSMRKLKRFSKRDDIKKILKDIEDL